MKLKGIITENNTVVTKDGRIFNLPMRGIDEILIDATLVGGSSTFKRQPARLFIGMVAEFYTNNGVDGYNFKIVKT